MHTEAFTYTRQTLGNPPPQFSDNTILLTEESVDAMLHVDVENPRRDVYVGRGTR